MNMGSNLRCCRMCGKLFDAKIIVKHEAVCSEGPETIAINHKPPKEYKKKIAKGLTVAGLYQYEKSALKFINGENHSIILEREPENKYDANAIKVIAEWVEGSKNKSEIVGYVPKDISAKIAKHSGKEITGCLQCVRLPKKQTKNSPKVEPQLFYDIYLKQ